MFWLWTKKIFTQKLFYEFLQQNSTNNHNQFKYEYLNHFDSQNLCCISEQWNEIIKYLHCWNSYILWIRKWIILKSSCFSELSVKKWKKINFLNINNNFFVINDEIWFISKWKKILLLDNNNIILLNLINMNFATWNYLNIWKLKMLQVMKNFDEQFLYLMYYAHVKLQLEEHLKYVFIYLTDLKNKYNIILEF